MRVPWPAFEQEHGGPDSTRQEGPHAHSIMLSPDSKLALAADLWGVHARAQVILVDSDGRFLNIDGP